MVCAIAAAIILSNAVIGEAGTPQSAVLRWSARLQLAVLPLLACFALYAMYLRLSEYGLTIARIYALILVLFAAAYAIAGFVSALMPTGYTFLRQANIWLAGALFAVAVLVQTPLFNTWQMTVDDQVARLEDGRISAADFDYAYFQFELGSAGKRALQELKEAENIPDHEFVVAQIERVEQAENRYDFNSVTMRGSAGQLVEDGSIEILPAGTVLDQSFIDYLERERWLIDECRNVEAGNTCLLLETDIFPVGSADLYVRVIDSGYMTIQLFYQDQGETWRQTYGETISATSDTERDAFLDRLRSGDYQGGTITFRTIQIGNEEIFFLADDEELRRIMRIPE